MIKGGSDVLLDTAAIVAGAGVIALPFLFVMPLPARESWPFILGSILVHLAYYFCMINAYRTGDLSLVYPIMRGVAPLLTAILGIFLLREWPGVISWSGMLLISVGVVALALRPLGAQWLAGHQRAVTFALINAAVIAIYTIIDGAGARLSGNVWSYITWLFFLDMVPLSIYLLVTRRGRFLAALNARKRNGLIGGGLSAAAYAISVWAMTKAPVALVASLRETSVLFATLLGAYMLKERLTLRRWAGVGAVLVGVVALKSA
jgi:drug/metabolite transporter (DMT)-like permease